MKLTQFITMTFVILMTTTSWAWTSTPSQSQKYSFKFQLKGSSFTYDQSATSYEEAFDVAAQQCFKHFKGSQKLTEDKGLDIIDACANPRTTKI